MRAHLLCDFLSLDDGPSLSLRRRWAALQSSACSKHSLVDSGMFASLKKPFLVGGLLALVVIITTYCEQDPGGELKVLRKRNHNAKLLAPLMVHSVGNAPAKSSHCLVAAIECPICNGAFHSSFGMLFLGGTSSTTHEPPPG
eukprot:GHVU01202874.1.p1 GENE.GHVU01202874.1~~GHVU01202874.1.p1  ORF type:complete len:142 (-),score=3.23 GHVU01202874.1:574-999(-)